MQFNSTGTPDKNQSNDKTPPNIFGDKQSPPIVNTTSQPNTLPGGQPMDANQQKLMSMMNTMMQAQKTAKKASPIGGIIMGIIFIAVSTLIAYILFYPEYLESKASVAWPSTQGVMTESRVTSSSDSDGTSYKATVAYKYSVADQEYTGNKISAFPFSSSDSSGAYKTVAKYPVDSAVTVYYSPEEPFKALLEPGISWGIYLFGGIIGLFFLIGFIVIISSIVAIKKAFSDKNYMPPSPHMNN